MASAEPPPDVASAAGCHFVPLHFKTCPATGAEVVVSTSDNVSIPKLVTSSKPSAAVLTLKKPFAYPLNELGVSVSPVNKVVPLPPPPPDTVPGFHFEPPASQTNACPFVGAAVEVSTSDKRSIDLLASRSLTQLPA